MSLDHDFDEDFEDDIQTLKDFYFISINKDGTTFGMHALMQLATRYWLEFNELLEHWKSTFTNRMLDLFPTPEDPENKGKCQLLYPHVLSASSFSSTRAAYHSDEHILRLWTLVLHLAARYALGRGHPREALELSSKSMKAMEESIDPEDSRVLGLLQLQAFVQSYCGLLIEAEKTARQLMDASERIQGVEGPSMLTAMHMLAASYRKQGRWEQSIDLYLRTLEIMKRLLGSEDPSTLATMANLACVYFETGRIEESEAMHSHLLETTKDWRG